jgi:hypothetical protein
MVMGGRQNSTVLVVTFRAALGQLIGEGCKTHVPMWFEVRPGELNVEFMLRSILGRERRRLLSFRLFTSHGVE